MRADAFAPRWAGGWAATRVAFAFAALFAQLSRAVHVRDALQSPTLVLASGPTRLADHVLLGPAAAWGLWGAGLVALLGAFAGGRWAKPGLLAWLGCHAALLTTLGLNVRAPERLIVWVVAALCFAPIGERGLTQKWRSPAARWLLLLVACGLYGSTGWLKLFAEPAWWSGDALRYDLVDRFHAGGALATWVSSQPDLCRALSWAVMGFEATFPLLVWLPVTNPWVLLAGVAMHAGIGALMDVGALGPVALSMYPALLDPDRARAMWERLRAR